jgi:hypothetical protein
MYEKYFINVCTLLFYFFYLWDMAFTQEDLDNINKAIALGAREVWYGDKRVAYNSLNDMLRARDIIRNELGIKSSKPKAHHPIFQKGLS